MADSKLPKAAIFDLDGTPLDSVDLHALAWRESVREEFVEKCRAWTAAGSSSVSSRSLKWLLWHEARRLSGRLGRNVNLFRWQIKSKQRTSRFIRGRPQPPSMRFDPKMLYRTATPDRTSDLIPYDAVATEEDFVSAQFECTMRHWPSTRR
jgi:phosphoglycolate phosphatase-like HAD superfamily hydrolase